MVVTETKRYTSTKDFLKTITLPEETRTYKPVSHQQLIDLTLESIDKAGFKVDKEFYSCTINGMQANGRYTISNVADEEMQLQIGWQNSYNKTLSLKFAVGSVITICSNGVVRGDMGDFKKKHMGAVQEFAPKSISEYISKAGNIFEKIQQEREQLKQVELNEVSRAELLGRLYFQKDIIKPDQISIIRKEILSPTHDYNCKDSAWELYNYCNYAMKETHPANYFQQHKDLHNFFVAESGLLAV